MNIFNTNSLKLSVIPLWTRICVLGMFYLFIHLTVVLPVMEFQGVEIAITENMTDRESEVDSEEIDVLEEHTISDLSSLLYARELTFKDFTIDELRELHHRLSSPPPEFS